MQKNQRQEAILDLIQNRQVRTQNELAEQIRTLGVPVTQATISRDIAELGIVRRAGRYAIADGPGVDQRGESRLRLLLKELHLRVRGAVGTAVLKTDPGAAQTLASALDGAGWSEVVGTVAGDDTIFVALPDRKGSYQRLAQRLAALGAFVER